MTSTTAEEGPLRATATSTPTPMTSSSNHTTYRAGEDASRLAKQARQFGLAQARVSRQQQQQQQQQQQRWHAHGSGGPSARSSSGLSALFHDNTFSAAMMHSVGTLGGDEYVDDLGTIHLVSVRQRRRRTLDGGDAAATRQVQQQKPDYGTLHDLFQQGGETMTVATKMTALGQEEEEDDDEFEVEDQVEGGSLVAAIFGIVKGTIGPAILFLPRGFKLAGWAVAIPALILATFAYIYSAHRLLACWKVVDARQRFLAQRMGELQTLLMTPEEQRQQQQQQQHQLTAQYASTMGSSSDSNGDKSKSSKPAAIPGTPRSVKQELDAFVPVLLTYPELARRAFGPFAILIEFGIASMQFGVCLTYLIFVPANLYASCQTLFGLAIPKTYFLVVMLLIEIPCSWIRDIRRLTPFNIMATLLIAYGLGSCLVIAGWYSYMEKEETLWESVADLPAVQPTWFLFIGTAFFVFEGSITLVVPLQEAVYKSEDRAKFPMVNQHVTTSIVVFYVFFAMFCWASFGDRVQTALTASLPAGIYSTTVQFAYAIAVILTYPLQAFPAMEVTLKGLSGGRRGSQRSKGSRSEPNANEEDDDLDSKRAALRRNVVATFLNLALGVLAVVAIDYLGNVVSLLGSLVGMPIALIYPPFMHNILVKDLPWTTRFLNYSVSGIGGFATVAATYGVISNWDKGSE